LIVRVPATSANLGPGYDCMGLAFELYNDFYFEEVDAMSEEDKNSLMYETVKYFYEQNNLVPPNLKIRVDSKVPMTRGLGSSATCIVAGLIFANEYSGLNLDKQKLLEFATKIEGHPDNVVPAFLGGLICAFYDDELVYYKAKISENLKFTLLIPDFSMETKKARMVVKGTLSLDHAISNIARSNLVFQAIRTGDMDLLKKSAKDFIHEPYRKTLISDYDMLKDIANENNSVLFISGAGSSLLVISEKSNEKIGRAFDGLKSKAKWEVKNLNVNNKGAYIIEK
jgi:homoserine kinase